MKNIDMFISFVERYPKRQEINNNKINEAYNVIVEEFGLINKVINDPIAAKLIKNTAKNTVISIVDLP
jgi:hypothetical protein